MIFLDAPTGFKPKFEVASVFILNDNEFLMIKSSKNKPTADMWGVPAGKLEKGESINDAAKRELFEETGIKIKDIKYFKTVYVRYPEFDFIYHMHQANIPIKITPILNPEEHIDFKWSSPKSALNEYLIPDEDSCIKLFFQL